MVCILKRTLELTRAAPVASNMKQQRNRGVECSDFVRHRQEYLLFRGPGQPAECPARPSPHSCLAGRGRKIIRGRRNPGRRSCLACPGLLSDHPYGISVWLAELAKEERRGQRGEPAA